MHKKITSIRKVLFIILTGMLASFFVLYGCGKTAPASTADVQEKTGTETETEDMKEEVDLELLARGDLRLNELQLANYGSGSMMLNEEDPDEAVFSLTMPNLPRSDDANLYLFTKECYEEAGKLAGAPVAEWLKEKESTVSFPYKDRYLFEQFIPALLIDGKYTPVAKGVYLGNPELLAQNQEDYPEVESKKGLLLDPAMLGKEELTDLGVKHAIYNIPLSAIMGETADEEYPTIFYEHEGKKYAFNGAAVSGYDGLFAYLAAEGMCTTVVVLNDWNDDYKEMIHPKARNKESGAYYYMFNTKEKVGTKMLQAVACFLAERYSGKDHGMIHNWVIANEINQHKTWNYMDTKDVEYYTQEFEKGFRTFYQAIKSNYANAKVYFSIDHKWNSNGGNNRVYFNGKEMVEQFNEIASQHGSYDWGVALHPYPDPLTRVNYWAQKYDKTSTSKLLTIMNLSVLTDLMQQKKYLNPEGEVRDITISELGFSSRFGEKLQAAAFAYGYYIVEANPYIDALLLNRQTDAKEEMRQGLSFGIYEYDGSEKYLKEIYSCIDTDKAEEYTEMILNVLGAESMEEALSWAGA